MKINLNLNEAMNAFKPWDLTLEIDSVDRKVRPITLADLKKIQSLSEAGDEKETYDFVDRLFVIPGQPPSDQPLMSAGWEHAKVAAVIAAVQAYYSGLAAKNSRTVSDQVRGAMGLTVKNDAAPAATK